MLRFTFICMYFCVSLCVRKEYEYIRPRRGIGKPWTGVTGTCAGKSIQVLCKGSKGTSWLNHLPRPSRNSLMNISK